MAPSVVHTAKSGATLTGTEYEAANHHVITGVAADDHDHDADYAVVGHDHDADYAVVGHTHTGSLTHPQVLARGLGA